METIENDVCVNAAVNLTGIIENIATPHFYTWRYSNHGLNWSTPYTSSSPTYTFNQSYAIGTVIFVELTAGNTNGQSAKVFTRQSGAL